jgi:hypothetical protein
LILGFEDSDASLAFLFMRRFGERADGVFEVWLLIKQRKMRVWEVVHI